MAFPPRLGHTRPDPGFLPRFPVHTFIVYVGFFFIHMSCHVENMVVVILPPFSILTPQLWSLFFFPQGCMQPPYPSCRHVFFFFSFHPPPLGSSPPPFPSHHLERKKPAMVRHMPIFDSTLLTYLVFPCIPLVSPGRGVVSSFDGAVFFGHWFC